MTLTLTLTPEVAAGLSDHARRRGSTPEELAIDALRERFVAPTDPLQPRDEWERRLLALGTDCGGALTNESLSSEGLYE